MRSRLRVAAAVALMASPLGCTSTTTQTAIRSAETAMASTPNTVESLPSGALAHPPPPSPSVEEAVLAQPVDLATLERAAIERNPSLVASAQRVRALVERAHGEGSLPAPELMLDLWQIPFSKPYAIDRAGMTMISVRQAIPAPGTLDRTAQATALEAQAEAQRRASEARALVREVDRAFADYEEATLQHAAHLTHATVVDQLTTAAHARYTTGAPLSDVARADLEAARVAADLEREHGAAEAARARINGLLARDVTAPLGPPAPREPETVRGTAKDLAARAAEHNPEIAAARFMARSASAMSEAAHREAEIPAFSVGVSTFLPTGDMQAGYGVSASMSLPWLWGGGPSRAKSADERARAELGAATATTLRVKTDAASALAAVRAAEHRLVSLKNAAVPAAHHAVEAAHAGYASGGTNLLAWLEAARTALEVDMEVASARGDLARALADLDFAVSERVTRTALTQSTTPSEFRHVP